MNTQLLTEARWAHHSNEGRRYGITLPAATIAHILGRVCPRNATSGAFYANPTTDAIEWGTQTVWKTGAQQVIDYVLASVTADDLDYGDYIDELMWRNHVRERGYLPDDDCLAGAPIFWRNGQPVGDTERDALLARQEAQRGAFARYGVLEGVYRAAYYDRRAQTAGLEEETEL